MNTFLPYPSLIQSVAVLDDELLRKQRGDTLRLLSILEAKRGTKKVENDRAPTRFRLPLVLFWEGFEEALKAYANAALAEWILRRRKVRTSRYLDYCLTTGSLRVLSPLGLTVGGALSVQDCIAADEFVLRFPSCFGDERFHRAHRASLIRMNSKFYRSKWTNVDSSYGLKP